MDQGKLAPVWSYFSQGQQDLLTEGQYLMNDVIKDHAYNFKDYSFLIFPFAKAYEGFLKKLFLDLKFISHLDYISDHYRLGKFMSPNLIARLGERSLYKKIQTASTTDMAELIWSTWKIGRNQVFHYFPHNFKAVSYDEAGAIIDQIEDTMAKAYVTLLPSNSNDKVQIVNQIQSLND